MLHTHLHASESKRNSHIRWVPQRSLGGRYGVVWVYWEGTLRRNSREARRAERSGEGRKDVCGLSLTQALALSRRKLWSRNYITDGQSLTGDCSPVAQGWVGSYVHRGGVPSSGRQLSKSRGSCGLWAAEVHSGWRSVVPGLWDSQARGSGWGTNRPEIPPACGQPRVPISSHISPQHSRLRNPMARPTSPGNWNWICPTPSTWSQTCFFCIFPALWMLDSTHPVAQPWSLPHSPSSPSATPLGDPSK